MGDGPHMLSMALNYAGAGISVFPVNGKAPLTEHGFLEATTDKKQIEEWWAKHPQPGIATPDFDAVDVDLYKPQCKATWERIRPLIPAGTPHNRTGGGGLQYLFQPGTLKDGKIGPGVDSRFSGRGYGHGAGFCQWGAKALADEGLSYRDILLHYYPGTELQQLY